MQEKVCPKCGRGNSVSRASCTNCYASLEGIPSTPAAKKDPPPVSAAPAASRTPSKPAAAPVRRPAPSPNPTQVSPGAPPTGPQYGQPAQTPYDPSMRPQAPTYRPSTQPVSYGPNPAVVVLLLIVLFGVVAGIALYFRPKPPKPPSAPPEKTVMSFLEAKKTGKMKNVRPYLCQESIEVITKFLGSRQARSAGFTQKDAENMMLFDISPTPKDLRTAKIEVERVKDESIEDNIAVVRANLTYENPTVAALTFDKEFEFVLVGEDGKWKVDLHATNIRERKQFLGL